MKPRRASHTVAATRLETPILRKAFATWCCAAFPHLRDVSDDEILEVGMPERQPHRSEVDRIRSKHRRRLCSWCSENMSARAPEGGMSGGHNPIPQQYTTGQKQS